jgi:hypothetical protein
VRNWLYFCHNKIWKRASSGYLVKDSTIRWRGTEIEAVEKEDSDSEIGKGPHDQPQANTSFDSGSGPAADI